MPEIGDIPVYDLTRTAKTTGSITDILDKVKANGGAKGGLPMANRVHSHLKTVLRWWTDRDEKFATQPMPSKKRRGQGKEPGAIPSV
ncbi:hypothetical protein FXB41_13720 [Bradyrhizobium canariense]|uniref:hypothetical protein n=1 Tax=Bradyrhizobium canariense TaxID=255045 RepID=UPI001CA4B0E7|nr:hypothetical protein [Bradyrhizobium canariense]MBW5435803.1 hypothetical protein [Bradyrhizobium canariense]